MKERKRMMQGRRSGCWKSNSRNRNEKTRHQKVKTSLRKQAIFLISQYYSEVNSSTRLELVPHFLREILLQQHPRYKPGGELNLKTRRYLFA
jgi:hypothetical protein